MTITPLSKAARTLPSLLLGAAVGAGAYAVHADGIPVAVQVTSKSVVETPCGPSYLISINAASREYPDQVVSADTWASLRAGDRLSGRVGLDGSLITYSTARGRS